MKRRTKMLLIVVGLIAAIILTRPLWDLPQRVKTAIPFLGIEGYNTIICRYAAVTGYDWYVISNEIGPCGRYCNITGATPWRDLPVRYEFMTARNTFVFHVDSRTDEYSEEMGENVLTYHAYDWDVLYPVKHNGLIDLLSPMSWHILESDLRSDGEP